MQKVRYLLISLGLLLSHFNLLSAQYSKADSSILAIMKEMPVMGLSVAVVKKNQIVFTNAYGYKNEQTKEPLATNHLFRIASISKSFTATAIMQLIEKRKLSLDDDISPLVGFIVRNPSFPEQPITLRMVLSHRSSINDSQGYFSLDAINPAKNANWKKCYNAYAPDSGYQYCNLNYNMAGAILERISGIRFDQYIQQNILKPLNLLGGYNVDELDNQLFAQIYEYNRDSAKFIFSPGAYASRKKELETYTLGYSTPIFSPTGGMKISAPDLAKYMMVHANNGKYNGKRVIAKKSVRKMQTMYSENEQYGLALSKSANLIEGKTLIGHTGSAYGLYSIMFFEPKEKFGIVVISNGCDPSYEKGFNKVLRRVTNVLYENIVLQ
ncbi:serine hydrolase domain-containing protein [Sediminibacterium sp. TEGAF015]|uniref:serine hydrolase domain-containing protein n=1 Tax=Sediminibacterium sp. TEGAF015 TaxID=575378 RepID=UPI0021FB5779|nr:serine hydrolase domain-containing protein [Sediminibacterium sp. TEGAF015]BDQ12895.1 hypothetical protein TEGAF0_21120 [Sediminibacterium sp. TEGAF015]